MTNEPFEFLGVAVGGPPRPTRMCPHIGGPYDGVDMPVQLDDDGEPVELSTTIKFTDSNMAIPAFAGTQSNQVTVWYEREERLGEDGFEYVYRFAGEQVINPNSLRAA